MTLSVVPVNCPSMRGTNSRFAGGAPKVRPPRKHPVARHRPVRVRVLRTALTIRTDQVSVCRTKFGGRQVGADWDRRAGATGYWTGGRNCRSDSIGGEDHDEHDCRRERDQHRPQGCQLRHCDPPLDADFGEPHQASAAGVATDIEPGNDAGQSLLRATSQPG